MSDTLLGRLLRAADPALDDRYFPTSGSVMTAAGVPVTADRPIVSAVYRCGALLSNTVAGLPGGIYRKLARGRQEVPGHPVSRVFWRKPNPYQNHFQFKQMLLWHAIFRGAAFARIVSTSGGGFELWPLHPDRMEGPELLESGRLRYTYRRPDGRPAEKLLEGVDLFVFKSLAPDGLKGLGMMDLARETFGLATATERYGASLFSQAARYSGALKLRAGVTMQPETKREVSESIRREGAGPGSWWSIPIFEDGMEWQNISMSNDDAQFLETRKFTISDIARWFGIPPHMIGDVERSTSWGTGIEAQATQFVAYGLLPWLVSLEAVVNDVFLPDTGTDYARFNVKGLLRGDTKERFSVYEIAIRNGIYSPNDCREFEEENAREGGDEYVDPRGTHGMSLQDRNAADGNAAPGGPEDGPAESDPADGPEDDAALAARPPAEPTRAQALADLRRAADALGVPEDHVRKAIAAAKPKNGGRA